MSKIIRWSGSKNASAEKIISYFPKKIDTYYECFLGGGSILLELLENYNKYGIECKRFVGNDINRDLISIWNIIKLNPIILYNYYYKIYQEFIKIESQQEKKDYYTIKRNYYNSLSVEDDERPLLFYWLTRTCFNGLIRYNSKGEFNSAFHLNRNGMQPNELLQILITANALFKKYSVEFQLMSFESIFDMAEENDFLYCDPPYESVKAHSMYLKSAFNNDNLFNELNKLNKKQIKWALSYDGFELLNNNNNSIISKKIYKKYIEITSNSSCYRNMTNSNSKNKPVLESLFLNYIL